MLSYNEFNTLEWKKINIYFKKPPELDVPKLEYYNILKRFVKPIVEIDGIKCYYFSWDYHPPNIPYHISVRIGFFKGEFSNIHKEVTRLFNTISSKLLREENIYELQDYDNKIEKEGLCQVSDDIIDEKAYYWLIMHRYSGSAYFLEIIKHGYEVPRKGVQLLRIPHFQWNLMGSRFLVDKNVFSEGVVVQKDIDGEMECRQVGR